MRLLRKLVWTCTKRCDGITPTKFQGNEYDLAKGGGSGVEILCCSVQLFTTVEKTRRVNLYGDRNALMGVCGIPYVH
ncbi:hypothetical protein [Nostoc sp. 'Peltigera membranacea cyanobiont' N6]|uniref:hypothetical protein n=1 Tax=Nostoc sp. 'Peltigera membranacea cyanobiont' N6 TaxID=1261031 RepID=UPI0011B0F3C2|nr:hypothetical protein [Nostoc sp. 'Peltigera membranacea cyanobiont' N6]